MTYDIWWTCDTELMAALLVAWQQPGIPLLPHNADRIVLRSGTNFPSTVAYCLHQGGVLFLDLACFVFHQSWWCPAQVEHCSSSLDFSHPDLEVTSTGVISNFQEVVKCAHGTFQSTWKLQWDSMTSSGTGLLSTSCDEPSTLLDVLPFWRWLQKQGENKQNIHGQNTSLVNSYACCWPL